MSAPRPEAEGDLAQQRARVTAGLFGRDTIYVLLWGLQLVLAALITPAVTRLLAAPAYGRIMAATAVMQVLVAVGSMSLQAAVQREYQREDGVRRARRLVTLAIVVSAATFVVADLTGPEWTAALRLGPYHGTIQYAVAWAAMTAISDATLGLLRSADRLGPFSLISLLQSVGAAAFSLALVLLIRRSPSEFVLGQLIAQAAAVVVGLALARPLALRRRDLPLAGSALRYSGALVPAALAAFALTAAARLIIVHDLGTSAVARYSIAFNIGTAPLLLLIVLDVSWMPRMFALAGERLRGAVLSHSRDAIFALLIPTVVGLSAGAPILLAAWAPPSYHPDGLLLALALLCVSALPLSATIAATRVLLLRDRTGPIGTRTVLAGALTVAPTIALVPPLGLDGAALATLAGYCVQALLIGRAAHAIDPIAPPPRALLAKCAAAVALAGLFSQLPTDAGFIAARALVTLGCLAAFTALLCELVAPGRLPGAGQLARSLHLADGQR
jgi:O-antigen/teichoic acid export membrane protein